MVKRELFRAGVVLEGRNGVQRTIIDVPRVPPGLAPMVRWSHPSNVRKVQACQVDTMERWANRVVAVDTPSEVERLRAAVAAMRAVLERVEYGGTDASNVAACRCCPLCGGHDPAERFGDRDGHDADCDLAKVLAEGRPDAR